MRIVEEEQAAARLCALEGEPRVVASGNFAAPLRLLELLDAGVERYRLFMLNASCDLARREGVVFETPFVGAGMRGAGAQLDYLPMRLSLVPHLFRRSRPPDCVLLHTSTIRAGRVSLGIEVNILVAAIEQTRARGGLVVAQINPHMPYTLGDSELDCDQIDLAIEVDEELAAPPDHEFGPVEEAIGENVAALVDDGATVQLGIGAIPDATLASIADRRGLAVWSEMISDGVLRLERRGSMDPSRPIAASFLFGSRELYDWVDGNPRVQMIRTEVANDPGMIARQPGMVSVNAALQVDLFAQANASWVGGRIHSGFGGQPDFTAGALHARGGHAIVALRSWHEKSDSSTVVPLLSTPVTSFQHSAVVSEHGTARIFGRSAHAQARLLVDGVAAPGARPALHAAAAELFAA